MTDNIYQPPASELIDNTNQIKIYSPNQIAAGSFWGGSIAAFYFLYRNYVSLGNDHYARTTIYIGSIVTILIFAIIPFLPDSFPNLILPLSYTVAAQQICINTQLTKEDIQTSNDYTFASNWKVFGIGLFTLMLSLAIIIVLLLSLESFGMISLE